MAREQLHETIREFTRSPVPSEALKADLLEAQLRWAHADGIGFFAFDWYYNPDPGNGPINKATTPTCRCTTTTESASPSTT